MGLNASVSATTLSYLRTNTRRSPNRWGMKENSMNKSSQEFFPAPFTKYLQLNIDNELCNLTMA